MTAALTKDPDGTVQSPDGWQLRFLGPDLIEYCTDDAACLVNVGGFVAAERARPIFASESSSELFPALRQHLASAAPLLGGRYVVV